MQSDRFVRPDALLAMSLFMSASNLFPELQLYALVLRPDLLFELLTEIIGRIYTSLSSRILNSLPIYFCSELTETRVIA